MSRGRTCSLKLLTIFTVNQKVPCHNAIQVSMLWLRDLYPFGLAQNRGFWFRGPVLLCYASSVTIEANLKKHSRSVAPTLWNANQEMLLWLPKCFPELDGICLYSGIIPAFMSAFVSLKVLEVVVGTVCLLLVRLAAFVYDMNGTDSAH